MFCGSSNVYDWISNTIDRGPKLKRESPESEFSWVPSPAHTLENKHFQNPDQRSQIVLNDLLDDHNDVCQNGESDRQMDMVAQTHVDTLSESHNIEFEIGDYISNTLSKKEVDKSDNHPKSDHIRLVNTEIQCNLADSSFCDTSYTSLETIVVS